MSQKCKKELEKKNWLRHPKDQWLVEARPCCFPSSCERLITTDPVFTPAATGPEPSYMLCSTFTETSTQSHTFKTPVSTRSAPKTLSATLEERGEASSLHHTETQQTVRSVPVQVSNKNRAFVCSTV